MKTLIAVIMAGLLALTPTLPAQAETVVSQSDEQITIRPGDKGEVLYEYRINGQIKEIRVVPKIGKPYYLVPSDTRGGPYIRMDSSQLLIPSWVLFRW